jgi:hypothetical protein
MGAVVTVLQVLWSVQARASRYTQCSLWRLVRPAHLYVCLQSYVSCAVNDEVDPAGQLVPVSRAQAQARLADVTTNNVDLGQQVRVVTDLTGPQESQGGGAAAAAAAKRLRT